ncbi:MAG: hypothetical protein E7388_05610 [Ruminococcaceae bacterium]|nr:hypothetical protein [Oscillospiraceae bacterium]
MDKYQQRLMENLLKESNRKNELVKLLESFPTGSLVVQKKGNYSEYYIYYYEKGRRKYKYLSQKKDKELIEIMGQKKEVFKSANKEIAFISQYIKLLYPMAKQIYDEFSMLEETYGPSFSEKKERSEQLTILTDRGELVRSKSERFIADTLFKLNLDYRYEQRIDLGGIIMHPDFTVKNPLNDKIYYWEHLGLNNERYLLDWENRKLIYKNNGIKENINLIVTTEEDKNNFGKIAENIFTMKRYRAFVP